MQNLLKEKRALVERELENGVDVNADYVGSDMLTNLVRANMASGVSSRHKLEDDEVKAQIPLFVSLVVARHSH